MPSHEAMGIPLDWAPRDTRGALAVERQAGRSGGGCGAAREQPPPRPLTSPCPTTGPMMERR